MPDFNKRITFNKFQLPDKQLWSNKSNLSEEKKNTYQKLFKKPTKVQVRREKENKKLSKKENIIEKLFQRLIKSQAKRTIKPTIKKKKTSPLTYL